MRARKKTTKDSATSADSADPASKAEAQLGPLGAFSLLSTTLLPLAGFICALMALPAVLGPERGGGILSTALSKAFKGGVPGFLSALVQIVALMWLRTLMNYQYKTGLAMRPAFLALWREGGIPRLYKGILPAILLVPLSRFGDVAANAGVLALLEDSTLVPVGLKTASASVAAATWRMLLMPLNVLKTNLQANGSTALASLQARIRRDGTYSVFFRGTLSTFVANWTGHYPWFATRNALTLWIPEASGVVELLRLAAIGFCASVVSDVVSNSVRVVTAYRQVADEDLSYLQTIRALLKEGGLSALFFRGLGTKLFANGLNSIVFNVGLHLLM